MQHELGFMICDKNLYFKVFELKKIMSYSLAKLNMKSEKGHFFHSLLFCEFMFAEIKQQLVRCDVMLCNQTKKNTCNIICCFELTCCKSIFCCLETLLMAVERNSVFKLAKMLVYCDQIGCMYLSIFTGTLTTMYKQLEH